MSEGGKPLPLAFQYMIFMVYRPCDLNLVMISLLTSKCQDFKVEMPFFQIEMLVGVASLPPSFPPSRTKAFYIIKRQNCINI